MAIKTVLTEHLGIEQPVISAPMALVAGARLAAAVSEAGGLGLIGGGYGDGDWLQRARVGVGFINWCDSRGCWISRSRIHRRRALWRACWQRRGSYCTALRV
ncbi:MAG: nitronate monooxygenase [Acidiferrobacterales bacterium]